MQRVRTKTSAILAGCLLAGAMPGNLPGAQATVSRPASTVAVAPFARVGAAAPADLANITRAMQEAVIDHLRAGGRVAVLSRNEVIEALQALHMASVSNPAAAAKLGRYLHVNEVVMGTFREPQSDELRADALLVRSSDGQTLARANSYGNDLMTEGAIDTMGEIITQGLTATVRGDGTYIPPQGRALTLTTSLNSDLVETEGGRVELQIDLQAAEAHRRGDRMPLNLSLVIDRSGSMAGEKLEYTKQAARTLVNRLGRDDYMSLIVFDDNVQTLIQSEEVRDKQAILRTIDSIQEGGSTNLGGGMMEGYAQVNKHRNRNRVNRVLLLSDGLANVGEVDPERLQSRASSQSKEGITISTLGVGLDYNENLMLGLSRSGRGNYYFIESPEAIPNIITAEAQGLMNVVAKDIHLEVQLASGVRLADLSGYKYTQEGNRVSVEVPDLYSKDHRYVILELNVPSGSANHWRSLAQVQAHYNDVLQNEKNTWIEAASSVRYTPDRQAVGRFEHHDVVANVSVNRSARAMEQAGQMLDKGNRQEALQVLKQTRERLTKDNKRLNRTAVTEEANTLDRYEQMLAAPTNAAGPGAQRAKKAIQFDSDQRFQNRK